MTSAASSDAMEMPSAGSAEISMVWDSSSATIPSGVTSKERSTEGSVSLAEPRAPLPSRLQVQFEQLVAWGWAALTRLAISSVGWASVVEIMRPPQRHCRPTDSSIGVNQSA